MAHKFVRSFLLCFDVCAYFCRCIFLSFDSYSLRFEETLNTNKVYSSYSIVVSWREKRQMHDSNDDCKTSCSFVRQSNCVCRRDRSVETISLSGQSRGNNNKDGLFARIKKKGDRRRSKGGRTEETTKDSKWNAFSENLGSMVSRRLLYFMRFTDICQFREKKYVREREREMNKEIDVEDRIQSLFHELCKLHDTK